MKNGGFTLLVVSVLFFLVGVGLGQSKRTVINVYDCQGGTHGETR